MSYAAPTAMTDSIITARTSYFLSVACGGGRNSAMLLGMYERGIVPDLISFANTGGTHYIDGRNVGEKPATYRWLELFDTWLQTHGMGAINRIVKQSKYTSLYDNCVTKGTLPSLAYGWHSCSDKWKIQPQERFHNNYAPVKAWRNLGNKVTRAIGYSAEETRRAKIFEDAGYQFWYPLIEWGWDLQACKEAFARHGLPVPPKSACFFCPASKKEEVLWLAKNEPELFALAVEMERKAAPNLTSVKGLGRRWAWGDLVQITPPQRDALPDTPEMACACFDPEDEA